MTDTLIVVASHKKIDAEKLGLPFLEVYRSESDEFEHTANKINGIKSSTISWSEYAQFFYPFPLDPNIKTFGLIHYRCILDLSSSGSHMEIKKFSERKDFFNKQTYYIDEYKNNIVIGKPLEFSTNSWQQFVDCHPNVESTLYKACKKFDSLFSDFHIDSEKILKSNNFLYSRNLFIGPRWFADKWYEISMEIVKYLDDKKPKGADDRWGGFILERLFSVYLYTTIIASPDLVIQKPIVFFSEG